MEINGTTALVLGASRGIGLAIAQKLARRGVRLVLPWYDWPESVKAMKKEFSGMEQNHVCIKADLRREEEVNRVARLIERETGSLDILINNIERGGMPVVHGPYTLATNKDQWQREMETTLHAKWMVFNSCLPLLQKAEQACVINLSSIAALTGRAGIAGILFNDGYAAANRGIETLTQTWARLGAPSIRVNELMLGIIDSRHGRGTRGWGLLTEEEKQQLVNHTLLQRTGTPEEVARAVLFLLEQADFMTGSTLRIDGGFVLGNERVPAIPPGILEK
ncbi:MAG TPA: SDR family oxidoreductase [Desulfobulbaceae bacterium]|nr:SDR family oxidoreductase [Desulfobulbaceae bacterium]